MPSYLRYTSAYSKLQQQPQITPLTYHYLINLTKKTRDAHFELYGTVRSEITVPLKHILLKTRTHGHVTYSVSYFFKHTVLEAVQAHEIIMKPDIRYAKPKIEAHLLYIPLKWH